MKPCQFIIAAGAPAGWLIGAAIVFGLGVPLGVDRARALGHALADGYLVVREGTLVRRRVGLGADSVIGWTLRQSPFQRQAGLATLVATTACGRQRYRALDIDAVDAVALARAVTPGLLEPFLTDGDRR